MGGKERGEGGRGGSRDEGRGGKTRGSKRETPKGKKRGGRYRVLRGEWRGETRAGEGERNPRATRDEDLSGRRM